jgi:hypothetical protein
VTDSLQSSLVVEGWIEADAYPIVKLTHSVPISEEYQSLDSLEKYVARWERITVSDGEHTATLTGRMDRRYMPPYVYTTTDIKGMAGRTYTLTIHGDGQRPDIVASTTIPEPAEIDSFSIEQVSSSDSLCQLFAHMSIPQEPVSYYKLSVQTDSNSQDFLPSFLGVLRSDMIPDDGRIAIHRGRTNLQKDFTPYFAMGDTVIVRIAHIDSTAYEYWRSYEDMLSLSRNPMFPVTSNMHHSINGVYGFWQGWGTQYYMVAINR